jgi:Tol biopolymer transport system component
MVQSSILPPEKSTFAFAPTTGGLALSPDGRRIALLLSSENKTMLWLRPLNGLSAQPLVGTEGAVFPFWSPDGRFVAFFAGGKLKKIDANGGPPQSLCDVGGQPRGGSWGGDGVIVFAASSRDAISKVAAEGGAPAAVTALGKGEFSHRWPSFLPDGRHFLYLAQAWVGNATERNKIYIGSLDSTERRELLRASGETVYSPPGYVVFLRERTLLAQPFDARKLRQTGEAFPIAERVEYFATTTTAIFSLSQNGVLAYRSSPTNAASHLSWLDRSGKELEVVAPPGDYNHPRLSHDGKQIAYEQQDSLSGFADIWTFDLTRKVPTRLTFDPSDEVSPNWSPDDQKILYTLTEPTGTFDLCTKSSAGSAAAEVVLKSESLKIPMDWSKDGSTILFQNNDPRNKTQWDVFQLSLATRSPAPVLAGTFSEQFPQLSPDGHWIAYVSDQSGHNDVYIEPFPPHGGKWQISTGGGSLPRWRRDGKELFYRTPDDRLMSVTINATNERLEISTATPLFRIRLRSSQGYQYDVSADGQKFLMNVEPVEGNASPVTLVTNWTADLKR